MDRTDAFKRAAAGTAMAGALSFGIVGVGTGIAAAKPDNPHPNPPGPGVSAPGNPGNGNPGNGNDVDVDGGIWGGGNLNPAWLPGDPPGQNPFGPPGQVKKMPALTLTSPIDLGAGNVLPVGTVLPNPLTGPPGHWGDVNLNDMLEGIDPSSISWLPPADLLPVGAVVTTPLQLVQTADGVWGVNVTLADGTTQFVVYPFEFSVG